MPPAPIARLRQRRYRRRVALLAALAVLLAALLPAPLLALASAANPLYRLPLCSELSSAQPTSERPPPPHSNNHCTLCYLSSSGTTAPGDSAAYLLAVTAFVVTGPLVTSAQRPPANPYLVKLPRGPPANPIV